MKNLQLKQRVNTLSKINQMRKRCDTTFLNKLSDYEIHSICEACYNILGGKIPINKNNKFKLKKKLIPIRNEIRKLGNSKTSWAELGQAQPAAGLVKLLLAALFQPV